MNWFTTSALLACLALTACDKPNHPEPSRAWDRFIAWDEAEGRFQLGARPAALVKLWDFQHGMAGFEASNARLSSLPGQGLAVVATATDPFLRTPASLRLPGSSAQLLVVRLTRLRTTEAWDGALYYSTDRHGESPKFMAYPLNGPPIGGSPTTLVYDLTALRAGGRDWGLSTVDQIRLDLDTGNGGEVVIHQIALLRDRN